MSSAPVLKSDGTAYAGAISITLAFTAGYVDTLGFVGLFGLFTAHVTGNFVLIGSELAKPSDGVLIKLLAFPAFILAVVGARLIAIHSENSPRDVAPKLLALQAILLTGFMTAGWFGSPFDDSRSVSALVAGVLGAAAMGVQNAAGRLVWGSVSPTTVMTGNVTQLTIDLVDMLRSGGGTGRGERVGKFLWPVVSFGAGAITAAFAYGRYSFLALILPIALIGGLVPLVRLSGRPSLR